MVRKVDWQISDGCKFPQRRLWVRSKFQLCHHISPKCGISMPYFTFLGKNFATKWRFSDSQEFMMGKCPSCPLPSHCQAATTYHTATDWRNRCIAVNASVCNHTHVHGVQRAFWLDVFGQHCSLQLFVIRYLCLAETCTMSVLAVFFY